MELTTIQQLPMAEIQTISKTFFESGLFADTKSAAQAMVRILAGQEIGIPPFAAMSGIHIIAGKPTIGAGLIASRVKGSGKYDYKVTAHDDKICTIEFYQAGEKIGSTSFTVEDAKKAGTKNLDKFPKNMLFARAISNGVKFYCPDVFSGPVYVPEEMQGITEDVPHEVVEPTNGSEPKHNAAAILKGKKLEELKSAIQALDLATTVQDLKDHKSLLPAYVVSDASFVTAATERYNLIMATAANVTNPQPA